MTTSPYDGSMLNEINTAQSGHYLGLQAIHGDRILLYERGKHERGSTNPATFASLREHQAVNMIYALKTAIGKLHEQRRIPGA